LRQYRQEKQEFVIVSRGPLDTTRYHTMVVGSRDETTVATDVLSSLKCATFNGGALH